MSIRPVFMACLVLFAGCRTTHDGTGPNAFDLTGTFAGSVVVSGDPFFGSPDSTSLRLVLTQSGASVAGTWEADSASGTLTATVSGSSVRLSLTQVVPCDGSYNGTGVVTFAGDRIRGSLEGSDCRGTLEGSFVVDRTNGQAPPRLRVSPSSIVFAGTVGGGDPAPATVEISNSGGGTVRGLAIDPVSYGPGAAGWLGSPTLSATTAPSTITLSPTTGALSAGTYTATVTVTSTTASNSPRDIDITLVVSDPSSGPRIALSSDSVIFTAMEGGSDPAPSAINVTNAGTGSLTGLAVGAITYGPGGSGWLGTVNLMDSTAPATLTVQATVGTLPAGTYEATVEVTSPVASNSPAVLVVTFTVTSAPAPPSIVLASTMVGFSATQGGADPAESTVNVSNGGGGILDGLDVGSITYGSGSSGWLSAVLGGPTAPTTLTLHAATGSLVAGTYTATVAVTSGAASNSPQNVTVTFTVVDPPPSIAVAPSTVGFTATAGGADPPAQSVNVTNGGGGVLGGLSVGAVSYGAGASGWLSATLGSATAPTTLSLLSTVGGLAAGTYTASVPILSSVAANSPQTVAVTLTVSAPAPVIMLGATNTSFTAIEVGNDPTPQPVSVTNGGGGTLTGLAVGAISYGAGGSGWLAAALSSSTAPATLTLSPMTGGLPAGAYTATVPITSGVASNSPATVTVSFTVTPAWIKGWNLRATAGFVTDGPGDTWFTLLDGYPTTRNGVTFGVLSGPFQSRDRVATLDPRLAGRFGIANSGPTQGSLRIDLPGPGEYLVRLAVGDAVYPQTYQYVALRDGVGGPVLMVIDDATGTAGAEWIDAAGVKRTSADWTANNQATRIITTGSVLLIVIGEPGTGQQTNSTIAHVFLQKLTP